MVTLAVGFFYLFVKSSLCCAGDDFAVPLLISQYRNLIAVSVLQGRNVKQPASRAFWFYYLMLICSDEMNNLLPWLD